MGCGDSVGIVDALSSIVMSIVVGGSVMCTASLHPCIVAGNVLLSRGICTIPIVVVVGLFPHSM